MRQIGLIAILLITSMPACWAQGFFPRPGQQEKQTTVTLNIQLHTPGTPNMAATDATAAILRDQQKLFEIINHECDVLSATLKQSCKIAELNTNSSSPNNFYNAVPMLTTSANVTFAIGEPSEVK